MNRCRDGRNTHEERSLCASYPTLCANMPSVQSSMCLVHFQQHTVRPPGNGGERAFWVEMFLFPQGILCSFNLKLLNQLLKGGMAGVRIQHTGLASPSSVLWRFLISCLLAFLPTVRSLVRQSDS